MSQQTNKATISFRIPITVWIPDNRFQELVELFEKYQGVTDEITFFTAETHSPIALDVVRSRMPILAKRMATVRKLGYRSGANVIPTTGFMKENVKQACQTGH